MSLRREMEAQGQWLFRWRSYLPFLFVPLLIWAVIDGRHDGSAFWRDRIWPMCCLAVSIVGLGIRFHCIGHAAENTSGRNTKYQIADDLNTSGFYSIVRHPLYLGNFMIALGIIAQPTCWWLVALYIFAFGMYYERIMFAEEQFLEAKFGDRFRDWATMTPAFIPIVSRWRTTEQSMNFNKAAKQEAAAIGVITLGFAALELGEHYASGHPETVEPWWFPILTFGVVLYIALRLHKRFHRNCLSFFAADAPNPLVSRVPVHTNPLVE